MKFERLTTNDHAGTVRTVTIELTSEDARL